MNVLIGTKCPACKRLRKDHTPQQKLNCGEIMKAQEVEMTREKLIFRRDWKVNK